jgi:glycerol-3-phosphate dehydrogenase
MKIGVIGAGSWGIALACICARRSRVGQKETLLYSNAPLLSQEINEHNTVSAIFPGISLPKNIFCTNQLEDLVTCDMLIIATPAAAFLSIINALREINIPKETAILIASKGLCSGPVRLFSNALEDLAFENIYGFISGPSFAKEVVEGRITSLTITSKDLNFAANISQELATETILCEISDDVITVQIASIIKNIAAIQAGILRAKKSGENEMAALIAIALEDIRNISNHFGGKADSLSLSAVVGDLALTCYNSTSRNASFGAKWYESGYDAKFLRHYPILVEGVNSAILLQEFLDQHKITSKFCHLIEKIAQKIRD